MNDKFYTCRYDRPFKEIFLNEKNKEILKCLLESIIKEKIKKIEIKPTERTSENIKIKKKIFDALLETETKKIGIEVNSNIKDYVHPRNMAYICDMYASHTLVGEKYNENIDIIQINLTYGMKDEKAYRIYEIQDKEKRYVSNFKIYEINMDYYKKIWYSKNEKEIEKNKYIIMLDLELEELEKLSNTNKVVNTYMGEIKKLNGEIVFREYMSKEEDARKIYNTEMEEATNKGFSKGINEGIDKGKQERNIEIANEMLKEKMDINLISKITGVSIDEINKLANNK